MKNIKNTIVDLIKQYENSLVKFTGLFMLMGMFVALTSCKEKEVLYISGEKSGLYDGAESELAAIGLNDLSGQSNSGVYLDGELNTEQANGRATEEVDRIAIEEADNMAIDKEINNLTENIVVYICGAVVNPGVYTLETGSRVADGIEAAGGLTENAQAEILNLAKCLRDEYRVYIPTTDEVKNGNLFDESFADGYISGGENADNFPDTNNTFGIKNNSNNNTKKGININIATMNELMTLTGIGENKARNIIEYRQKNGNFKDIYEIMKVHGIKESSFNKIKDEIIVE